MVVFELAGELYGVNIAAVESIIKLQAITRMPRSPEFIEGIINLRGKTLAIIDLRKRFSLPAESAKGSSRIIVVNVNNVEVGMIVDGVSEVLTIPQEAIQPTPPLTSTVDSAFITAIAKVDQRLVILLDLEKVLSVQEKKDLAQLPLAA
ncbi:MAG: chemotaxis protein CheW [Anaerolineaceae bacterium]|nr:chemotaxis protein CheW [Anaerolineaceae bacterium]